MTEYTRLKAPTHVHWRRFGSELVVVDLAKGEYYGLSDVAAGAFEGLVTGQTVSEVLIALAALYSVSHAELKADMDRLLADLVRLELLAVNST